MRSLGLLLVLAGHASAAPKPLGQALCRLDAPHHLHVRTLQLTREDMAEAQRRVADAVGNPGVRPNATKLERLRATYQEIWLSWDESGAVSLRRIAITPDIKAPWSMKNATAESGANDLDTYLHAYAPVRVELTIERGRRTIGKEMSAPTGSSTHYTFHYDYTRDWKKREQITASGGVSNRTTRLGYSLEMEVGGEKVIIDRTNLASLVDLHFTLKRDATLEQIVKSGKPETRAGVRCIRGKVGTIERCFSTDQCLTMYAGTPTGHTEVLALDNNAIASSKYVTPTAAVNNRMAPGAIALVIPEINDIYARYYAAVANQGGNGIRPTLYNASGGGGADGGDPKTPPDNCQKWTFEGQRLLCKKLGSDRVTTFAASYVNEPELASEDDLVAHMFAATNPDSAFFTQTFDKIPPKHWRFVIALERARRSIVDGLGPGSRFKNECHDLHKCTQREEFLDEKVAKASGRSAWKHTVSTALMDTPGKPLKDRFKIEHTAGCYRHHETGVEIVVDSWRNTFSTASDWWKRNDAATHAKLGSLCGSYCGPCACLYTSYKALQRPDDPQPASLVGEVFSTTFCSDHAASFAATDAKYGEAIRKDLTAPDPRLDRKRRR